MAPVTKLIPIIIAAALVSICAEASDGQINFEGNIIKQTCTVAVNGVVSPILAITITLPTVSVGLLNAAGKTAGRTDFEIELSNCSGPSLNAFAFFEASTDVEPVSGQLIAYGDADNLRFQLLDNSSGLAHVIKAGDSSQLVSTKKEVIVAGKAILKYAVEYFATGVATAGYAEAMVTYSISYQ